MHHDFLNESKDVCMCVCVCVCIKYIYMSFRKHKIISELASLVWCLLCKAEVLGSIPCFCKSFGAKRSFDQVG